MFCLAFDQFVDQCRRGGEVDAPLLPASSQAQTGGQVTFSGAAIADQYDRFLAFDITTFSQLANAGCWDLLCLCKVELFERLDARQLRIANAVVDGVPVALFALDGQQRFQIPDVTVVLLHGLFGQRHEVGAHGW